MLWEKMIAGMLEGLGFKATTHEHNLYQFEIDGKMVLVCHQVDDFMVASKSPMLQTSKLIAAINRHEMTENAGIGVKVCLIGLVQSCGQYHWLLKAADKCALECTDEKNTSKHHSFCQFHHVKSCGCFSLSISNNEMLPFWCVLLTVFDLDKDLQQVVLLL